MADVPDERPAVRRKSPLREVLETLVLALLFALIIRTFVVEVYQVSGSSMTNTLYDQERVLVNKFIYKLVRDPRPGDIIVFKYPRQPERDFIKRVVAVAGDTVEMRGGVVYVNGEPFNEAPTVRLSAGDFGPVVVPPDSVFVLGDNRSNSEDSRYFGEVPLSHIRGLAVARIWPLTEISALAPPAAEGGG
ncbi:signal peptidase I [Symbiobacterium thermophilum]|uniref:Signal peptidase I n=1 Tax=Symbiobacterium thermophilum TaxID=2734 RepID=A0A953LJ60_SYMTR|nr:signal peptidase I [Symbiobacterium thermophilum]MBY6275452.1 signal peptidase I [Symbiobacterium thermophilum]